MSEYIVHRSNYTCKLLSTKGGHERYGNPFYTHLLMLFVENVCRVCKVARAICRLNFGHCACNDFSFTGRFLHLKSLQYKEGF